MVKSFMPALLFYFLCLLFPIQNIKTLKILYILVQQTNNKELFIKFLLRVQLSCTRFLRMSAILSKTVTASTVLTIASASGFTRSSWTICFSTLPAFFLCTLLLRLPFYHKEVVGFSLSMCVRCNRNYLPVIVLIAAQCSSSRII